jgi:predicted GNAT family acetyltransferase
MTAAVQHDVQLGKFFVEIDGKEAHLLYTEIDDATLDFRHTFVPPELRGRQLAEQLVQAGFDYAREHGFRVVPTCSYVQRRAERDPDLKALTVS